MVQLDHDEEMEPMHGMYGTMDAELEVRRSIKEGCVDGIFCVFSRKLLVFRILSILEAAQRWLLHGACSCNARVFPWVLSLSFHQLYGEAMSLQLFLRIHEVEIKRDMCQQRSSTTKNPSGSDSKRARSRAHRRVGSVYLGWTVVENRCEKVNVRALRAKMS